MNIYYPDSVIRIEILEPLPKEDGSYEARASVSITNCSSEECYWKDTFKTPEDAKKFIGQRREIAVDKTLEDIAQDSGRGCRTRLVKVEKALGCYPVKNHERKI